MHSNDLSTLGRQWDNGNLLGAQVPNGWATWSDGNEPRVLVYTGSRSVTGTFSLPLYSFGLEMQPNYNDVDLNGDPIPVSMTLALGNGNSITQLVYSEGGASFFGWVGEAVASITLSTADDSGFAFGRMVRAPDAGMTLILLGLSLGGISALRRKLS